jgi:hypothetical protein
MDILAKYKKKADFGLLTTTESNEIYGIVYTGGGQEKALR